MAVASMLSERSASVLDADPHLGAAMIAGGAGALAHASLLPVLRVDTGVWEPPERGALGAQTGSLVVLAGWLSHGGAEVFGPGDMLDPWRDAAAWRACTPARLAVIGAAWQATLEAAQDAAAGGLTPRKRPLRLERPDGAESGERLLTLLWRLAARWARPGGAGPALPRDLDAAALATLLGVPRAHADAALAALLANGAVHRAHDGGWQLAPPARRADTLRGRRDQLRARMAEQFALARAVTEDARLLRNELNATRAGWSRGPTGARRRSP
jgi:hypothetical protein